MTYQKMFQTHYSFWYLLFYFVLLSFNFSNSGTLPPLISQRSYFFLHTKCFTMFPSLFACCTLSLIYFPQFHLQILTHTLTFSTYGSYLMRPVKILIYKILSWILWNCTHAFRYSIHTILSIYVFISLSRLFSLMSGNTSFSFF